MSRTARIVHAAMIAGLILFGIVAHFIMLPKNPPTGGLDRLLPIFIGLSLLGCALSVVFSQLVPRPTDDESDDDFWRRANPRAMIAWALAEGSALLAIVVYSLTGSWAIISVAILAVVVLGLLNPGYFEGR
jgi:O-antigen ligase